MRDGMAVENDFMRIRGWSYERTSEHVNVATKQAT